MGIDAASISTDQLAAFVQLARLGSLRAAAETLFISEQGLRSRLLSLEQLVSPTEEEGNMKQEISSPGPDPSMVAEQRNLEAWVTAACEDLSERERLVLQLYYHEELTLKEIGELLHLTEGRICQIHARAILRLRKVLMEEQSSTRVLN